MKSHEIDILDVPLAPMLAEYLEWVKQNLGDIEGVGDFIALAAHLLLLKVRVLLPGRESALEDLNEEELLSIGSDFPTDRQYTTFKELASDLGIMEASVLQYYGRPTSSIEFDEDDGMEVPLTELLRALTTVVRRVETSSYEVDLEEVDLETKIKEIFHLLASRRRVLFEDLFPENPSRIEIVVTFMAILELVKMRRAIVKQRRLFEKIWVYGRTDDAADRGHRQFRV